MRMRRRRRMLALTNYRKRIALLKSGIPRLVVRKSNRSITVQIIKYEPAGDLVLASADSNMLRKFGWEPRANIPTAYLTGMLIARNSRNLNVKDLVLDIGLNRPIKSTIIFAAAKGAQDGGLKLRGSFDVDEKRASGSHIASYAKSLDGEAFKKQFAYASLDPRSIEEAFAGMKAKLMVVD